MVPAPPGAVVKDLATHLGAMATALISGDGRVLAAELPAGMYPETFGILCAMALGAAGAALNELGRAPPEHLVIEAGNSRTILVPGSRGGLLVVVVDRAVDLERVLETAARLGAFLSPSEVRPRADRPSERIG